MADNRKKRPKPPHRPQRYLVIFPSLSVQNSTVLPVIQWRYLAQPSSLRLWTQPSGSWVMNTSESMPVMSDPKVILCFFIFSSLLLL